MKATMFPGMTAALAGAMVLEGFSGLPFLFSLAIVIASVAVAFGAGVVTMSLLAKKREPVRLQLRRARARA